MKFPLFVAAGLVLSLFSMPCGAQKSVWIEGEAFDHINVKPTVAGWGHKEFLSGEKWLQVSIDADRVDKEVAGDGVSIEYSFALAQPGSYELWNRIGYEFVRSPFQWRIDSGEWNTVSPDQLTIDLMELQNWNEVAWLEMGDRSLAAGRHRLEIKLPKTKDDKGNRARILYASDAICIHSGSFYPNGKHKPEETVSTPVEAEAARRVYSLPPAQGEGNRAEVPLQGLWEICRDDEMLPGEVAAPLSALPAHPHWSAIAVPGDKNSLRPDLLMAHRIWYRTHIDVPASYAGRSFQITFPQNNLNTTVFVNGTLCGFNKNPYARFQIDLTKAIVPGKVNELWVGIRDGWYGYSANPKNPMKLRKMFNMPLDSTHQGFQDLAYPIWGAFQSGILATPTLTASGPTYVSDVFCRPSVVRKELALTVMLNNPGARASEGTLLTEAVDDHTGKVEKSFPPQRFTVPAGKEQTLEFTASWEHPTLWWPDAPHLYRLRATVRPNAAPADRSETTFGFREWTLDGTRFKLNGVAFHGWSEDVPGGDSKATWLAGYHRAKQKMMRFWGTSWFGLTPDQALDYFDHNGVVVRRQGMLDGEAIGYNAIENDPDLKSIYHSDVKMDLMQNWRDQVTEEIKGERNHPSVMIWSIENEWLYINCINLYGGLMDAFEAEVKKTSDVVLRIDPSRPTMTDGGGANKDNSMPVHGNHYITGPLQQYPDLAYQPNVEGGGRGRWIWDQKRPRFVGEDFYFTGNHPELSTLVGDEALQGKASTLRGCDLMARYLTEGYRWAGYGAWDLYIGANDVTGEHYNSNSSRAVFCRQWDWTFGSGQKVKRTLGIFNDTHDPAPITLTWSLNINGKTVAQSTTVHRVAPGENEKFPILVSMPLVADRSDGMFTMRLVADGHEVFRDVKPISIVNPVLKREISSSLASVPSSGVPLAKRLCVYDPAGIVEAYLKANGVAFTALPDLSRLPETGKVLIVGRDSLDTAASTSSRLAAYASSGRTVIVLEQKSPLRYQALPAEIDTAQNEGRSAFAEDLDHPVMKGLMQKDFFAWGPDEIVYRNAYVKPSRGGRSLIQCDNLLQNSALVEIPAGKGLLLLCQLTLEEKLVQNVVAQQLLSNLIAYGAKYKLIFRQVTLTAASNPRLNQAVDTIGLAYKKLDDPLKAIATPGSSIALMDASPQSLKELADHLPQLDAYLQGGGWVVFNNLTPEGLVSYNKIVGFDHMIRPFKREKVTFPAQRNPLMAGVTGGDITMYSSQPIFNYTAGNYVASDEFSYVIDYDEVAPFGKSSFFAYDNIVNNFVSADGWPLIINFPAPADGKPFDVPITFPKPQTLREFTWVGNVLYYPQNGVNLVFDGKDKLEFSTRPDSSPQSFAITPPRTGKEITLQVAKWTPLPNMVPNIGIDNIYFKAQRPPGFYKRVRPMLNIGGMMHYPRGTGGIILCNLLFRDTEEVSDNAVKKRSILATLLHNLRAPFAGGKTLIAGANLSYQPIDLSKQANQYRDERGWYGDKSFTFRDLPTGRHQFANVPFQVYDFPTSPVPTVVMLNGSNVPNSAGKLADAVKGIPVGRKAEALFFLQAARIDQRRNEQEIRDKKLYEMAKYVVHYADGKEAEIPVYAEVNVDDYHQQNPAALPGAQIGWIKPYAGTNSSAVAYVQQWNNPRPGVPIRTIDMIYGQDRRGVPALLAVTSAVSTP